MKRRLLNLVAGLWAGSVWVLQWLGIRAKRDAWRNCASINLREEPGKMMIAAFGVRALFGESPRAHGEFAVRLRTFLAGEPIAHFAVEHHRYRAETIPISSVDVCLVEFGDDGKLLRLLPVLDPVCTSGLDAAQQEQVELSVLEAANATLAFDVTVRVGKILRQIARAHPAAAAATYAQRILRATFVTFENATDRFLPPDQCVFRFPGAGMFNFVIRDRPDGTADIWMQGQHTALDGVEFARMLARLETNFGGRAEVLFPAPDGTARHALAYPHTTDRELGLVGDFFDFGPLRRLKRTLNRQTSVPLPVPVTEATLLLWTLGNQPEFAGETFALAVDVPPRDGQLRRLDFIVIRPWEFFADDEPLDGFPHFLAAYTDRLRLVQAGRSRPYRSMQNLARLPASLADKVMRLNKRALQRGMGTITLSLLKSVPVSLAPASNLDSERATFVFGDMLLPSESGTKVGWVTIKGVPGLPQQCSDALRRALSRLPARLEAIAHEADAARR